MCVCVCVCMLYTAPLRAECSHRHLGVGVWPITGRLLAGYSAAR
jgi:hypothetical protein